MKNHLDGIVVDGEIREEDGNEKNIETSWCPTKIQRKNTTQTGIKHIC